MKPTFLTLVSLFLFFALSTAAHADLVSDYYYSGPDCYGSNGTDCTNPGTELSAYPIQVPGNVGHEPFIRNAEAYCSAAGYEECSMVASYSTTCGDFPNGCTTFDGYGYSKSDSNNYGNVDIQYRYDRFGDLESETQWYAISKLIITSFSASPTSIDPGGTSQLSWTSEKANDGCSIDNGVGSVPANGSKQVSPKATTTYTLSCNGESNDDQQIVTVTAQTTVTVNGNSTNLPNYTEDGLAPTPINNPSYEPGTSVDFSAAVYNAGTANATSTSNLRIQVDPEDDGGQGNYGGETVSEDTSSRPVEAVKIGGWSNSVTSLSFAIPEDATVGTVYKFRACADLPPLPDGYIGESNENDNCGPDGNFTVAQGALPDLIAKAAATTNIELGQTENLSALVKNVGDADAVGTFPNIFQISTTSETFKGYSRLVAGAPIDDLAENASAPTTLSFKPDLAATFYVRMCANNNIRWQNVVQESNYNNNCSPASSFIVAPTLPDLIAGPTTVTPAEPTAGAQAELSAHITNQGDAGTGAPFDDLFQIQTEQQYDSGSGEIYDDELYPSGALGAGKSNTAQVEYAFPSPGTWYVNACADQNYPGDPTGDIAESNEDNNCGTWSPVTVGAATGPIVTCQANPETGSVNSPITWTATTENFNPAATFTWQANEGTPDSGSGNPFTDSYSEASDDPYTVQVNATNGTQNAVGYCSALIQSGGGNGGCSGSPTPAISATPNLVNRGSQATISWSAQNVNTSCTITGTDGFNQSDDANACSVNQDQTQRTIEVQTTYCIECDNDDATKTCATVNVVPGYHEI